MVVGVTKYSDKTWLTATEYSVKARQQYVTKQNIVTENFVGRTKFSYQTRQQRKIDMDIFVQATKFSNKTQYEREHHKNDSSKQK